MCGSVCECAWVRMSSAGVLRYVGLCVSVLGVYICANRVSVLNLYVHVECECTNACLGCVVGVYLKCDWSDCMCMYVGVCMKICVCVGVWESVSVCVCV